MKTKLITLLAFSTFASIEAINAQTPFPTNICVGITKPGTNTAAKNYTMYTTTDPSNGNYTFLSNLTTADDINGIGLNPVDNFVYGAAYVANNNTASTLSNVSFRRIGSDGAIVDLGMLPVTGQTNVEFVNFSAGTVGSDDTYFYTTMGLTPSGAIKFLSVSPTTPLNLTASDIRLFFCWITNISTKTANPGGSMGNVSGYYELNFSDPSITAGINAFLTQVNAAYPNIYDADGGIQDIAINPIDKMVYGYISYPQNGTTVGRPVVISHAATGGTSVVSPVGTVVNAVPGQEVSGVTFDADGNFYGLFTTGDYATINLTTGALENVATSDFPTLGGNLRGDLGSSFTSTPLAISLKNFSGKNNGSFNQLSWSTANEENLQSFNVERSNNSKDWSAIGTVATKNSNGANYIFNDNAPANGINFYRLKENGKDGKSAYSNIITISNNAGSKIVNSPNPTHNEITISGVEKGSVISIFDLTGKRVTVQHASEVVSTISLASLPANVYILSVSKDGKVVFTDKVEKF